MDRCPLLGELRASPRFVASREKVAARVAGALEAAAVSTPRP
jgi:hypothetical protein